MQLSQFEAVRQFILSAYKVKSNDEFVLSFDVHMDHGRRQGIYLAELETETGSKVLRVSTPISKMARVNAERCLRFNWAQRVGYLAVGDLDGVDWLHLCENRPYQGLDSQVLDSIIQELAPLADKLEQAFAGKDQL
jgi:hypothetical protein